MKNKNHEINEEKLSTGPLANMNKANPFLTPQNYFENLPSEISAKINSETSKGSIRFLTIPKLALAAAITCALLLTGVMYYINQKQSEKSQFTLTYDDLIKSGIAYEYDDSMLIDHYVSLQTSDPANEKSVNQNGINEYLIENNIDINLIINEL